MKTQSGSVLVYILIAVALFGALGFAVTQMMHGGSGHEIAQERAKVLAQEIMDYGRTLAQGVRVTEISSRCAETDLSFAHPALEGYENGDNAECQIFSAQGGGVNYQQPVPDWLSSGHEGAAGGAEWFFPNSTCVEGLPSGEASPCAAAESLALLSFVHPAICRAVDEQLGIIQAGEDIPQLTACHTGTEKFQGSYDSGFAISHPALSGQPAGCFYQSTSCGGASGYYVFYQVLKVR